MFLHVTSATPVDGCRVRARSDDGREGVADSMEALFGPMFEPLRYPDGFRTLRVDEEVRTIVWPNGTDLAPEYTCYQAFRDEPKLQAKFRKRGCVI